MRPAARIHLESDERKALEALLRAHGCTVAEQRRARILLLADQGWSTTKVAQELPIDPNTVSRWRGRIAAKGVGKNVRATLADKPRSGRPRSIDAVRRAQIVATACAPLPDGSGLSGWTLDLLKEQLPLRGIESPSRSSIHRILNDGDVQPHRFRLWLPSPDPERSPGLFLAWESMGGVSCSTEHGNDQGRQEV